MSNALQPLPGFDWRKVQWGGPDDVVSLVCSYCGAELGDDDEPDYAVPLILWRPDGSVAQFCLVCQERWWGMS